MSILNSLKGPVIRELMNLMQNQQGGLMGLVGKLKNSGLSDQVNSWISTGDNQRIDSGQVKSVLGGNFIQDIASKLGISNEDAADTVADSLPDMVDKLTPNGKLEEDDSIIEKGMSKLKGLFT